MPKKVVKARSKARVNKVLADFTKGLVTAALSDLANNSDMDMHTDSEITTDFLQEVWNKYGDTSDGHGKVVRELNARMPTKRIAVTLTVSEVNRVRSEVEAGCFPEALKAKLLKAL